MSYYITENQDNGIHYYYWPASWTSIVLLAGVCCLSSSVALPAGGRAGRRAHERSAAAGPGA